MSAATLLAAPPKKTVKVPGKVGVGVRFAFHVRSISVCETVVAETLVTGAGGVL
jgi:hypothetical protein